MIIKQKRNPAKYRIPCGAFYFEFLHTSNHINYIISMHKKQLKKSKIFKKIVKYF